MKILSYNVREWSRDLNPFSHNFWVWRYRRIRRFIQLTQPDVILFQELSFPASLFIPRPYRKVPCKRTSHPVYLNTDKLRMRSAKVVAQTSHYLYLLLVDAIGRTTHIVNVHGTWIANEAVAMLHHIDELIEPKWIQPRLCVIAGDFNITPGDVKRLCNARIYNTCLVKHPTYTVPANGAEVILDHAYTNVGETVCWPAYIGWEIRSDHVPVFIQY